VGEIWQAQLPVSRVRHQLETGLVERLRQVVAGQVVTEPELRTLAAQASGWARTTRARLQAAEGRLTVLNADPASALAEIAAEVRRVDGLSREIGEIQELIGGLERRARELRTAWLKHHAESGSPFDQKP
jgi:phage shock protein A